MPVAKNPNILYVCSQVETRVSELVDLAEIGLSFRALNIRAP